VASILSSAGRKAGKAKHAKIWTSDKLAALEKEAERCRDKFEHFQTLHKYLSKLIFKSDKNIGRLKRSSKKSPLKSNHKYLYQNQKVQTSSTISSTARLSFRTIHRLA
jgi:hypothetical protein